MTFTFYKDNRLDGKCYVSQDTLRDMWNQWADGKGKERVEAWPLLRSILAFWHESSLGVIEDAENAAFLEYMETLALATLKKEAS